MSEKTGSRELLKYLAETSGNGLQEFELSRLNRAANVAKELQEVVEELVEAEAQAHLARLLIEWRKVQEERSRRVIPISGAA
jgi:hypothetical protein